MNNKEAMKILCGEESRTGKIDDYTVEIFPIDIKTNLISNDYELDLDWDQDLTGVDLTTGNCEMFQGHSLNEVEF